MATLAQRNAGRGGQGVGGVSLSGSGGVGAYGGGAVGVCAPPVMVR